MAKVFFLMGLPASGKSTWAKAYLAEHPNTKRINKDDLRAMMDNSQWSPNNEKEVLRVRDMLLTRLLEQGYDVIIDDTNLAQKHFVRLSQIVGKKHTIEKVTFFDVPVDELIKRDSDRPHPVGAKVINEMYGRYKSIIQSNVDISPSRKLTPKFESYEMRPYNPDLEDVFIFDIDGTLAHRTNRSPYDMTKVYDDIVDQSMKEVFRSLSLQHEVIFVSGRNEVAREDTLKWIRDKLEYDPPRGIPIYLFMRADGDSRADYIIKEEIYREHILPYYNVIAVFDDRTQVVKAIRKLGVPVYQVADGNF